MPKPAPNAQIGFLHVLILFSALLFFYIREIAAEESFVLIDGKTGCCLYECGKIEERSTPCSTFKIALSLIGFDAGILIDESSPTWFFEEGCDDFMEAWKSPQTPSSWMKYSCLWFSKALVQKLGMETLQDSLLLFDYGNADLSGECAWINSSLKISPYEQALFIQKMLCGGLPVAKGAVLMTKTILFQEDLQQGWKLYGKTGWSGSPKKDDGLEIGWFAGWVEKESVFFPFAYRIRSKKIPLEKRVLRVKQLLAEAGLLPVD